MSDNLIQDYYRLACDNGMGLVFAAKCAAEVSDRVDSGRSFDCDAYRELVRFAFYTD